MIIERQRDLENSKCIPLFIFEVFNNRFNEYIFPYRI